ncbi:MAG: hypothetical protein U5R31_05095 [Acidimicrobiia bacterium]|nr:hypothetical protein [Acidimicrobiia bacterium]
MNEGGGSVLITSDPDDSGCDDGTTTTVTPAEPVVPDAAPAEAAVTEPTFTG